MKHLLILLLILSGILFSQQLPKYAPGQAIIMLTESAYNDFGTELLSGELRTSNDEIDRLVADLNISRIENILKKDTFDSVEEDIGLNRSFVIYFPSYTDSEIEEAVNNLKNSYLIEDAFPNALGYELIEPNDTYFSNQSNLQRIKMPQAWDIEQGSNNIRLAIFDTGFQPTHQEINSKIYLQKDFVDINFSDYPNWTFFVNEGEDYQDIDDDATGLLTHGTEVAQVAAAVTNNGYGVAGVGWNTPIVIVRIGFKAIPPNSPLGGYVNTTNFINALNWIRSSNSVKVINMSLRLSDSPNTLVQNAITACINSGIVIVAAAGNDGGPVRYPAAYSGVIAVSGVNSSDINSGWNVGPQLSVVAPANGVWINSDGNLSFGVGTSLSAPLVAGAAALILSQNPNLTPQVVKWAIEASAVKVPGMQGQIFHNSYGYGLLDVYEALRALNSIYVFKNSIMSNDNYGYLVIDNDIDHPVPSNSDVPVKYEANHTSRTDELPFLVNYNGTTQKFNKWYQSNSDYNLQLSFTANSQTPPIKDANFNPTVPVTIKNNFPEVGTLDPSNDIIFLKDPLFYYLTGNNWYQSNEFKSYSSPLEIQNNTTNSYGGIFLNQEYDPSGQLPFYKVRSPIQQPNEIFLSQTGRYHKFYFNNWSWSGTDPLIQNNIVNGYYETPVVFRSSNAIVKANLKGHLLSNTSLALSTNSQRNIILAPNGNFLMVYSSLGEIWYTKSTDDGLTWNNEVKLSDGAGDNSYPSIAITEGGDPAVVWQKFEPNYNLTTIYGWIPVQTQYSTYAIAYVYPSANNTPAAPCIAWFNTGQWLVVWYNEYDNKLHYGKSNYGGSIIEINPIPNTTGGRSPSIGGALEFHLGNSVGIWVVYNYTYQIKAIPYQSSNNSWGNTVTIQNMYYNSKPQAGVDGALNTHFVWQAYQPGYYQGNFVMYKRVDYGGNWAGANLFYMMGGISEPNITGHFKMGSPPAENNGATIYWQNTNNDIYYKRNITGTWDTNPVLLSSNRGYPNSAVTGNKDKIPFVSLSSVSAPYFLDPRYYFTDPTDLIVVEEYKGIHLIKDSSYLFIDFSNPITKTANNSDTLNTSFHSGNDLSKGSLIKTNKFDHNPAIDTIEYKVKFTAKNLLTLLGNTSADIEVNLGLFNARINKFIRKIDGVLLGDTDGLTEISRRLRVVLPGLPNDKFYLSFYIDSTKYSYLKNYTNLVNVFISEEDSILQKDGSGLAYEEQKIPTDYGLLQNYPNPFNPSTKIEYKLPLDGLVTIKVYDMLGNEVATLVNEEKVAGKYDVNFDASRLASGIYLYRIKVNDFYSTKKMVFLK